MADWGPIAPSTSYDGRREGKSYVLRSPRDQGPESAVRNESRRRGYSEGGTKSRVYSFASPLTARPPKLTLDRNLVSEKSVAMTERTQEALFNACELDATMEDMTLWVHAHVVPMNWCREVLKHLDPIYCQMAFCREEVVRGWKLLYPPFYQTNLDSYERRLRFLERSVQLLQKAIDESKTKMLSAEAIAACRYIQLWTRRLLAKRGFYTKVIKLSYHHRGIVSGMFDSISEMSKLTTHRPAQSVTLEYPRYEKNWGGFS